MPLHKATEYDMQPAYTEIWRLNRRQKYQPA